MQDVVLLGQSEQRLPALAALTGLQHLHMQVVEPAARLEDALRPSRQRVRPPMPLPGRLLPHLQQLTHLHIGGKGQAPAGIPEDLRDVSCLKGLKYLGLRLGGYLIQVSVPDEITRLTQLTRLGLSSVSNIPNLAPLASLQHLQLHMQQWGAVLHATAVTGLTRLQHLQVQVQSYGDAANAAALLSWLQQQGHMTTLDLGGGFELEGHLPDLPEEAAPAALASLTAGSKLQQVVLHNMLSAQGWQHVFPAGQLCTALTSLKISSRRGPASSEPWRRIAAACPSLQHLRVDPLSWTAMEDDPEPTNMPPTRELQPLTALTSLVLHKVAEEHVPHLAQITTLRELTLVGTSISEGGLGQLRAMQQLTKLEVRDERPPPVFGGPPVSNKRWCDD
jgi:hypothetical protein